LKPEVVLECVVVLEVELKPEVVLVFVVVLGPLASPLNLEFQKRKPQVQL